jgi:hypothetical protein
MLRITSAGFLLLVLPTLSLAAPIFVSEVEDKQTERTMTFVSGVGDMDADLRMALEGGPTTSFRPQKNKNAPGQIQEQEKDSCWWDTYARNSPVPMY